MARTRSKPRPRIAAAVAGPKKTTQPTQPAKPHVSTHPAKKRTQESRVLIEKIRTTCMAHPDATEQIAWGEPTWRIGGRIFGQFDDHHHGGEHVSIWLPAPDGAQAALIEAEPEHIWRPPYVGGAGWIARTNNDPRATASRPKARPRRS